MDEAILASHGAYSDRNEFVSEAIWDRLNEDAAAGSPRKPKSTERPTEPSEIRNWSVDPVPPVSASSPGNDSSPVIAAKLSNEHLQDEPKITIEDFLSLTAIPAVRSRGLTLPMGRPSGINFGLHNRDMPTLWIAAHLIKAVCDNGAPVPWATFTSGLRLSAQAVADELRTLDAIRAGPVKVAIGFPRGGDKARISEDRFISTALGVPTREGAAGPAFLLGLVAADNPHATRPAVAPTPEALSLISTLAESGLGLALPQPPAAALHWLNHIASVNTQEYEAWLAVLRVIGDKPSRTDLIAAFPQWTGSTADTNCMGYVSRSREWGLVHAELRDGRYQLTGFGEQIINDYARRRSSGPIHSQGGIR